MTQDFKWTWETAQNAPGAGIVVVRVVDKEYKVLGLWARGGYDIPKGHVEDGEGFFETALRETEEESNITELHFKWGYNYIKTDRLRVYLAETKQEGKIVRNKESGILEHEHLKWLDWDEMMEKTYDYVKPAILWAKEKVTDSEATKNKNT
jgi:8-oxo-dGTP pyrophosphatase MutT (NUDIX family)